jgi:hypothetical protein
LDIFISRFWILLLFFAAQQRDGTGRTKNVQVQVQHEKDLLFLYKFPPTLDYALDAQYIDVNDLAKTRRTVVFTFIFLSLIKFCHKAKLVNLQKLEKVTTGGQLKLNMLSL